MDEIFTEAELDKIAQLRKDFADDILFRKMLRTAVITQEKVAKLKEEKQMDFDADYLSFAVVYAISQNQRNGRQ